MKFEYTEEVEPEKEECPYCGELFKSVAHHIPHCSQAPEKNQPQPDKDSENEEKKEMVKTLMKYFDYARSGHKYYKKAGFSDSAELRSEFYMKLMELADLI